MRHLRGDAIARVLVLGSLVTASAGACPGSPDLDDDGYLNDQDLLLLLQAWGPCPGCRADLDGDGTVGTSDLLVLLAAWAPAVRIVDSPQDLDAVRDDPTARYRQVCDLDLAGAAFVPIPFFGGVYDGGGHVIANVSIAAEGSGFAGLFALTTGSAQVRGVRLEQVAVTGSSYVGALVGYAHGGALEDVHVVGGSVTGTALYTGGLIGYLAGGSLRDASSAATVRGYEYTGGLVGYHEGGVITASRSDGTVLAGRYSGGLVGYASGGLIAGAEATGDVIGDLIYYGGGLAGAVNGGAVRESVATGDVLGYQTLGGGVGRVEGAALIEDCRAEGRVEGLAFVGGFAGRVSAFSTIRRCGATGDVSVEKTALVVGGFGGSIKTFSLVEECFALGDVSAVQTDEFGGVNIGGFVGDILNSSVMNSYARGSVHVDLLGDAFSFGGFIGKDNGFQASFVANCYATGQVTVLNGQGEDVPFGAGGIGGALQSNDGVLEGLFWDVETSSLRHGVAGGGPDPAGLVGLTTSQMQRAESFVGWDFDEIWTIDDGADYPRLRWQDE